MPRKIAIVIPAYNEAKHIAQVIKSIPRRIVIAKVSYQVVVVVVDDSSHDSTHQRAKAAGATVLRHVINCGAGAATRTGLLYAQTMLNDLDFVVTIDADGQHSSKDINKILQFAVNNNAKLIVGSRLNKGNKQSMPLHRKFGNIGLSWVSRLLFGIKTKDTQSGLRLFSAEVLPQISNYSIDRYGFCTEMLWLAKRQGIRVFEVPISVKYTEQSLKKGQNNWGVINLVLDLMWVRISR